MLRLICSSFAVMVAIQFQVQPSQAGDLKLQLRHQGETSPDSGRYHRLMRKEVWKPSETAIIVCDVWDLHHCWNAVRRVEEFASRLNAVLVEARKQGVTVIHSPSDCMAAYADHPARTRAIQTPKAAELPADIRSWCSRIPAEERGVYPIDQSDGGEDDDPAEHAEWAAKLTALGRNPKLPWKKQSDMITIDAERDFISDRGDEVWSVLEHRGIKNVILTGVHTNMCVLGRPFGLRQLAKNGKHVVLMRDLTDTMYNPQRWPYVSHFTGTDLIVSHIERFVCPTITSDQLLGGQPFRFKLDARPHLAIVMAEDEYETDRTLPVFASKYLGKGFRVSFLFGDDRERNSIPGVDVLDEADVMLVSVRRRLLPPTQMEVVQRFVKAGKPVVGIRTASHAFSLRDQPAPEGLVAWPEFDAQVFGGNYRGHHGNSLQSTVTVVADSAKHPILKNVLATPFAQGGSLYQTSPLAEGTTLLITGRVVGHPEEPVAWTFRRADGGRTFYTSMGHRSDFENPAFIHLLSNALHWAASLPVPDSIPIDSDRVSYETRWSPMLVPASWETACADVLKDYDGVAWYRCAVRIPQSWLERRPITLTFQPGDDSVSVWLNGNALAPEATDSTNGFRSTIDAGWIEPDTANLIVIRVDDRGGEGGLRDVPVLASSSNQLPLRGRWQMRIGDDPRWSNMPLPSRFGASTDVLFEP